MADTTDNHEYKIPAEGEQDWHVPLNENFESLERDVEIRDTASNRSNYTPTDGARFLATDTGRVSLGDGSSWQPIASTGASPTLESLLVSPDSGTTYGVRSQTAVPGGVGVKGYASDARSNVAGVEGETLGRVSGAAGVRGLAAAKSGEAAGVRGRTDADQGVGVDGVATSGGTGIRTRDRDGNGMALEAYGDVEIEGELGLDGTVSLLRDFVGIDREDPFTSYESFGLGVDTDTWGGMYIQTSGSSGKPFYGYAHPGGDHAYHEYDLANDTWRLYVAGSYVMDVDGDGNLSTTGNKNFVERVDTPEGEKEVVYTATEAGTPHTEATGVVELEDGQAEVALPDHFGWVTDEREPLAVQVTPHAREPVRPQVVERSTDRIVIADVEDPTRSYEVSYTVTGTRAGRADKPVVRDPVEGGDEGQ